MKRCSNCEKDKELTEFYKSKKDQSGVQSWCKICSNSARMKTYYDNPSVTKLNRKKIATRNKQIVVDYLLKHPCVDCGETDILVLDFDHVKGIKNKNISILMDGSSIETLLSEIKKCEVRCANCHRRKTAYRNGLWYKLNIFDSLTQ